MSRQAIAAALARDDLASGERLVALALASFAGSDNRAWPGTPAAAARAGLRRSRYLEARDQLIARGLVVVEERGSGRGRSSTVSLVFADTGPWWDGDINVELFEAVLGYSHATGPARLLFATLAAVADDEGTVDGLTTAELCAVAGMSDKTYRRAQHALRTSGEIVRLSNGVDGRGNRNVWNVPDPRGRDGAAPVCATRRVAPAAGARPLLAASDTASADAEAGADHNPVEGEEGGYDRTLSAQKCPVRTGVSAVKGGQDRTVLSEKCPVRTGVSDEKCPVGTGVSGVKGGQERTLFELPAPKTPAQTTAETPAPSARAGKEPQNPRTTEHPPNPPPGRSSRDSILIEQTYVTDRGRKRRRPVRIDLEELRLTLGLPRAEDHVIWGRIRTQLADTVSETTFAVWLEPLELIAIDHAGLLVVAAPDQTGPWVRERFGRVITQCAEQAGRPVRLADEPERLALGSENERPVAAGRGG
jgi:hypothetical protein